MNLQNQLFQKLRFRKLQVNDKLHSRHSAHLMFIKGESTFRRSENIFNIDCKLRRKLNETSPTIYKLQRQIPLAALKFIPIRNKINLLFSLLTGSVEGDECWEQDIASWTFQRLRNKKNVKDVEKREKSFSNLFNLHKFLF